MRTGSEWMPKGDNALLMPYLPADSSGQSHSLKEAVRVCKELEGNGHRFQLLDLGCGRGDSQAMLREQLRTDFHWIGLDIADSPEVRLRVAKGEHFYTYDGIHIPFRDHSIDLVYSHQVFEHVREPRSLLQEVYRVLRPGGFFVGSTSHLEAFHSRSVWNYTPYGFAELIHEAGFGSVKVRPGIDGFTLLARRLLAMAKAGGLFSPFFQRESPFNIAVEVGGRLLKLNVERRCALKLLFCGHFVFVAERGSKEKQDVSGERPV
jgi:SAM-dependent methyltransferase